MKTRTWIQTASGRAFDPFDPNPDDITIEDIAHHLANQGRFSGATKYFYSVAQHSIHVAAAVAGRYGGTAEEQRIALMHDTPEAYIVDLPRPIKHHPDMQAYRNIEVNVWNAIATKFNLPEEIPEIVKLADDAMLMTERRDLMAPPPFPWATEHQPPLAFEIECLPPREARMMFLVNFQRLFGLPVHF